jgi:hypothetical protein
MREETGPEPGQDAPGQDPEGQAPPVQQPPDAEARGSEPAPGAPELPGAGPARLAVVLPPETGDPRVDAALSLLEDLTELPVAEHPALFEQVHAQLSAVLCELGSSGPGAAPRRDGS